MGSRWGLERRRGLRSLCLQRLQGIRIECSLLLLLLLPRKLLVLELLVGGTVRLFFVCPSSSPLALVLLGHTSLVIRLLREGSLLRGLVPRAFCLDVSHRCVQKLVHAPRRGVETESF